MQESSHCFKLIFRKVYCYSIVLKQIQLVLVCVCTHHQYRPVLDLVRSWTDSLLFINKYTLKCVMTYLVQHGFHRIRVGQIRTGVDQIHSHHLLVNRRFAITKKKNSYIVIAA